MIYKLEEPYPTECYNHGQMAKQTQRYYMCKNEAQSQSSEKKKEAFRVSRETYDFLTANHTDQYSCYTREVETNVCVCPKGKSDFECLTASYSKCYLNITDPTFYKGCEDREDSPYYLYSVPGYSPCWPVNFTEPYTVEFYIICKPVDETGLVEVQREEVGYEYRDVIKQPEFVPFSQVSQNHEASFSLGDDSDWQVFLDLRDFKYLSHFTRFETTIKDEAVKNGQQPATVEVDF